jgi:hypothetical protein
VGLLRATNDLVSARRSTVTFARPHDCGVILRTMPLRVGTNATVATDGCLRDCGRGPPGITGAAAGHLGYSLGATWSTASERPAGSWTRLTHQLPKVPIWLLFVARSDAPRLPAGASSRPGHGGRESACPLPESGNLIHRRLLDWMLFAQLRGQIVDLFHVLE